MIKFQNRNKKIKSMFYFYLSRNTLVINFTFFKHSALLIRKIRKNALKLISIFFFNFVENYRYLWKYIYLFVVKENIATRNSNKQKWFIESGEKICTFYMHCSICVCYSF